MYKKLAGVFALVAVLAIFALPMSVNACDSCSDYEHVLELGTFYVTFAVESMELGDMELRVWSAADAIRLNEFDSHVYVDFPYSNILQSPEFTELALSMLIEPRFGCCVNQNILQVVVGEYHTVVLPNTPNRTCTSVRIYASFVCFNCWYLNSTRFLVANLHGCGSVCWTRW